MPQNPTSSTSATSSNATTGDPARLSLPVVDTSPRLYRDWTAKELKFFAPAGATGLGIVGAQLLGAPPAVTLAGVPVAGSLLAAGVIGYLRDRWWTGARDRAQNWRRYLGRQRSLPWGADESRSTERDLHGVERVVDGEPDAAPDSSTGTGVVEMQDGRRVGLVRIDGTNTTLATSDEQDDLSRALGRALDEDITDIDVTLYATTRAPDLDDVVGPYEERVADQDAGLTDAQTAVLEDAADWTRERDQPRWDPHDWRHYAIVSVAPWELDGDAGGLVDALAWWRDAGPSAELTAQRERDALRAKQRTVRDALASIDGVDATLVCAPEAREVIANYWRGRSTDRDHSEPADGDVFTPGTFDADRDGVVVDDEYTRTYWIADWPRQPDAGFLKALYTTRGVDLDVTVRCRARDRDRTLDDVSTDTARIDAEGMEREDAGDISAVDVDADLDAYLLMRSLLQESGVQPWGLTAYVTVRVDTEDALAHVDSVAEEYDSVALAKDVARAEASDQVEQLLAAAPASTNPVAVGTKQTEAFRSGSPVGRDVFAEVASVDIERTVPGGFIGGLFPFCATTPVESDGLDLGRNTETMRLLKADPFERGSAPHLLTLGKSRSGKTFGTAKAVLRWYLSDDAHNLFVCDTQNGFHGLTDLCDGKHVVVDGRNAINPLDIQPIPAYQRDTVADGVDPYRLKVEEVTQFIRGILDAQGVEQPGEYAATIEAAVEATYRAAGIKPHDLDSLANDSPTFADLLDTLADMLADTEPYTHTGHDDEVAVKQQRVSDLLDRLSGFQEGGKYHHLTRETDAGLLDEGVDMAYLDLQQLQGASDAEKSVMLQLALSQVAQKIKRLDGRSLFVIDEAHMLLHSDEQVAWLQKAAREWARYDAALWFVSQSPREFVESDTAGEENQRRTIVEQCSTVQFYYTELAESDGDTSLLSRFGMNDRHDEFVRNHAARGKDNDHSECLTSLTDYRGWFRTRVEASPVEEAVLTYARHETEGSFREYLANEGAVTGFDRPDPKGEADGNGPTVAADGGGGD